MVRYFFIFSFIFFFSCSSKEENKFNLNFERYDLANQTPSGWKNYGDYDVLADSLVAKSGKYSLKIISNKKEDGFGYGMYEIPAKYKGAQLTLEGYIKTEDVKDSSAGLFLRIDGNGELLAIAGDENQRIKEDVDWTKFSVDTSFPSGAEFIRIGAILQGPGKVWFDDLKLTIDGKDIQSLEPITQKIPQAKIDKTFDSNSTIIFPKITNDLTTDLSLLGKIWGFLKYHHPAVASGDYHWDYELFRVLPEYLKISTKKERNDFLLKWIASLGIVEKCESCLETDEIAVLKPDYLWLAESSVSKEVKDKLYYIYKNRHQGTNYYVDRGNVGQASFENEELYKEPSFPDEGYRLLGLFRYWNVIQYFSPYRDLTDTSWSDILQEYIPLVIHCKNELDYEKVVAQLVGEINDTHGFITKNFNKLDRIKGSYYPPFKARFIEGKLVVVAYYEENLKEVSKIQVGDVITHINDRPVEVIIEEIRPLYSASNEAALLRNISDDILIYSEKKTKITYISDTQEKQHDLSLYLKDDLDMKWYNYDGEKSYKILDDNIGYITVRTISELEIASLKTALKNTKGIIVDIRHYPYTPVFRSLGPYFISEGTSYSKFSKPNLNNPGEFNFGTLNQIRTSEPIYEGKLIVLVNEETQSQGEHLAMLFRSGANTTILGSTTAGADGDISNISFPGGLVTYFSGLGAYYPDDTPTQRVGIIPDIVMYPTIDGIKNNKDELLEKAIQLIKESTSN